MLLCFALVTELLHAFSKDCFYGSITHTSGRFNHFSRHLFIQGYGSRNSMIAHLVLILLVYRLLFSADTTNVFAITVSVNQSNVVFSFC